MGNITLENKYFALTLSESCRAVSLMNKETGEQYLNEDTPLPFFSVTEDRPYNNEIKLAYMNKRTTFQANRVRKEGDNLIIGFELVLFEAVVKVTVKDSYIAFTLVDFLADEKDFPQPMSYPPVSEFRLIQLPIDASIPYGQWLNVCHTEKSSVCVMSCSEHGFTDGEVFNGVRVLKTDARRGIKLRGCTSALICRRTEELLSSVEDIENHYGLPKGVASRRDPRLNRSIYWVAHLDPSNVDEHIEYAKKGGFSMMLIYYSAPFITEQGYNKFGDYEYRPTYPEKEKTLTELLNKIKAAGITPGFHFLHTHIGIKTHYVTPRVDHRLNLTRRFTLSRDISENDTEIFVEECPCDVTLADRTRVLRFGGEAISYEGYTEEYPYHFYGCERGHFDTEITAHKRGTVGGVLDLSEYTATSIYVDQNTDLQDEIADNIAAAYNCGFEFIYFDGSEGTNPPFEYHVPNAQYRVYKKLNKAPIFCEGAAKAHFGWHMLSGANAFDVFPTDVFKQMIIEHPFKEAALMKKDFTRVNFGWWAFYKDTRPDIYEFGTSKAASWDCPITMQCNVANFKANPRFDDIFEVMRRWEDVRATGWLTEEQKLMLRQEDKEFTLLINAKGDYELVEYRQATVGDGSSSVRAFVFERDGKAYATLWDDKGERTLVLPKNAVLSYTKEVETEPLEVNYEDGNAVINVSKKAYIRSEMGIEQLTEVINNAKVR